jgi:serine phosphatase RsbU (regulator of sigma subunit)
LDLSKNELLFSSAGHPAQFYIDQKNTNLMEKQGRLIGILGDTKYKDISFPFYPGSKIFLFTDGAYEQFSEKREEYGEERLINIINENQNESGEDILNNIIKSLDEFSGDGHREDDLTMIWINYKK